MNDTWVDALCFFLFTIFFWDIRGMRGWCIRRGVGFSIASFSGTFACLLQLYFSFLFSAVCFSFIVISSFFILLVFVCFVGDGYSFGAFGGALLQRANVASYRFKQQQVYISIVCLGSKEEALHLHSLKIYNLLHHTFPFCFYDMGYL